MRYVTAGFILFIILIVVCANSGIGKKVFDCLKSIPYGDKFGHFFLMGVLCFLVNMVFSCARTTCMGYMFLKGSLIVAVAVTIEEISQIFIQTRTFSLMDLVSDYAGILVFGWIACFICSFRPDPGCR